MRSINGSKEKHYMTSWRTECLQGNSRLCILHRQRERSEKISTIKIRWSGNGHQRIRRPGRIQRRTSHCIYYEIDNRKEWTDESCWKKANPGLGTIKINRPLRIKWRKQRKSATCKNLLCKEFNIRETSSEAWLTFEQANNTETFSIEDLKPRYGVGGVDLSSTTDLTAAKVLFKIPESEKFIHSLCIGYRKTLWKKDHRG